MSIRHLGGEGKTILGGGGALLFVLVVQCLDDDLLLGSVNAAIFVTLGDLRRGRRISAPDNENGIKTSR